MIRLTPEQMEVVYSEHSNTYVIAKAGAGKTTTLTEFVRYRKKEKFLYLVYNKSIKDTSANKFPDNTDVHTIHSLAYITHGSPYKDKLTDNLKMLDVFENLDYFKDKKMESSEILNLLYNVTKLLKSFFNFSVKKIEDLGAPDELMIDLTKEYWEKMKDLRNENVKMTHEGYLKLYHLSNPILKYDYIMVDEAQDSNEVMLDIIYSQKTKRVFVGDEHQKIYGFRGAINVFTENKYFNDEEDNGIFYLTESFRFGNNIANVANKLLSKYKLETNLVKGTDKEDKVGYIDYDMPYTIITRTNAHLFDLAYEAVKKNKTIHIIGGENFIFNEIKDGYYLYSGQKELIRSEYLKTFKSFVQLKNTANNANMSEYKLLIKIIETYKDNILKAIEMIISNIVGKKRADVVLTTAHKSKGLEFLDVKLAEDFIPLYDDNGLFIPIDQIDSEEINLYYVALTRAMDTLELNRQLYKFIKES